MDTQGFLVMEPHRTM